MFLKPSSSKLLVVLLAMLALVEGASVAPLQLAALLGVIQWFDHICRPLFATLDNVYEFALRVLGHVCQSLDDCMRAELLLVLTLAPAWEADLRRPWLPEVLATDASTSFGFGVCTASTTVDMVRDLGRLAERRGDYVRLDRVPGDDETKPRIGSPHHSHLNKSAFSMVLSQRFMRIAAPGALEATGLCLTLRWLIRTACKHSHRVVVLVEAKAVLGAAAEGRTSAASFRMQVRRIAALSVAGNFFGQVCLRPFGGQSWRRSI